MARTVARGDAAKASNAGPGLQWPSGGRPGARPPAPSGPRGRAGQLVVGLADGVAEHPVHRALAAEDGEQALGEPACGVRAGGGRRPARRCGGAAAPAGSWSRRPRRRRWRGRWSWCVMRVPPFCPGPARVPGGNFVGDLLRGRAGGAATAAGAARAAAAGFTYQGDAGPSPARRSAGCDGRRGWTAAAGRGHPEGGLPHVS